MVHKETVAFVDDPGVAAGKIAYLEGEVERVTKQCDEAVQHKAKLRFELEVAKARADFLFEQVKELQAENEQLKAAKDAD